MNPRGKCWEALFDSKGVSGLIETKELGLVKTAGTLVDSKRTWEGKFDMLTDTSEKKIVEQSQKKTRRKKNKTKPVQRMSLRSQRLDRKPSKQSDDSNELCLICTESHSNSRSGELWIQCIVCKI